MTDAIVDVDEATVAEAFRRERARQFMRRQRLAAMSGAGPAGYLYWLVAGQVPVRSVLVWAVLLVLVDSCSVVHTSTYLGADHRGAMPLDRIRARVRRQIALQTLAGVVWGSATVWANGVWIVLTTVVMVITAVFSIAVIGMLHYRSAFTTFTVGFWLTPAIVLLGDRSDPNAVRLGVGTVVLAVALNFFVWEASRQLVDGLYDRFRVAGLAQELRTLAERNIELASRDDLTGLLSRREGMRRLGAATEAEQARDPSAVLLIDVDHFKRVNDTYGHPAGDLVLREVASRLAASVRAGDQVFRMGGEEFMVVLSGCAAREEVAERLRGAVADAPITLDDATALRITVSVGMAVADPSETPARVYARADEALYRAKEAGRNRVVAA